MAAVVTRVAPTMRLTRLTLATLDDLALVNPCHGDALRAAKAAFLGLAGLQVASDGGGGGDVATGEVDCGGGGGDGSVMPPCIGEFRLEAPDATPTDEDAA